MLWEFAQYSFLGVYTNEFGITWDIVSSDNSCHVAPLLGLFALETTRRSQRGEAFRSTGSFPFT